MDISFIILFTLLIKYIKPYEFCEKNCKTNGICTEPHSCSCNFGYRLAYVHLVKQCLPICEMGCINGFCVEPGKCECYEGFKKNSSGMCVLVHNEMINPMKFSTNNLDIVKLFLDEPIYEERFIKDYTSSELMEEPIPSELDLEDQSYVPKSTVEVLLPSECPVLSNDPLFDRDICNCSKGYQVIWNEYHQALCQPLCNNSLYGCKRGVCISVDVCHCFINYVLSNNSIFVCVTKDVHLYKMFTFTPAQKYLIILCMILLIPLVLSRMLPRRKIKKLPRIIKWKGQKLKRQQTSMV